MSNDDKFSLLGRIFIFGGITAFCLWGVAIATQIAIRIADGSAGW